MDISNITRLPALGLATAVAAMCALGTTAVAQDYSLSPAFGTVELSAGFMPDPHDVEMVAGGSIDASTIKNGCAGYIADAPDFRLMWDSSSSLIISVNSDDDTTLVINSPDGNWHCDDDSGDNFNPSVHFSSSGAGQYDIWVGTYGDSFASATLSISEYASH